MQLKDKRFGVAKVRQVGGSDGSPPLRIATFQHTRYILQGDPPTFTAVPRAAPEVLAQLPQACVTLRGKQALPAFHKDPEARAAAAARYGHNLMVRGCLNS